nr:unnamed protein product [Callosobruchus chinensis]
MELMHDELHTRTQLAMEDLTSFEYEDQS